MSISHVINEGTALTHPFETLDGTLMGVKWVLGIEASVTAATKIGFRDV